MMAGRALEAIPVGCEPVTRQAAERAGVAWRNHRSASPVWNALIVRAAERAGCTVLLSEDLADGEAYGSVRVVNPFRDAA